MNIPFRIDLVIFQQYSGNVKKFKDKSVYPAIKSANIFHVVL